MKKYTGVVCEHCKQSLTEDEDIVVCPICGTPFHRKCYNQYKICPNEEKHSQNFVWVSPNKNITQLDANFITCPNCGYQNTKEQPYCQSCGHKLEVASRHNEIPHNERIVANENLSADITSRDISAYMGTRCLYFLGEFKKILLSSNNLSWNWSAFLFSPLYFFYRKIYVVGALLLIIFSMISVPDIIYTVEFFKMVAPEVYNVTLPYNKELMDAMSNMSNIFWIFRLILAVVSGLFANKFILSKAIKDIKQMKIVFKDKTNINEYYSALYFLGKPSKFSVILTIMSCFGFYFILSYYLASLIFIV